MNVIIDNFDFWNLEAQKYYSFAKNYKGNKKVKAKELCLSEQYLGARKMDGIWGMIIKDNEGVFHVRSRTESVNGGYQDKAEWLPHICEELSIIPDGTVLLGEIYLPNNEGSRNITSVFNCLLDKSLERQKKMGYLHFYIFDIIAWEGKSLIDVPFVKRTSYYLRDESYLSRLEYILTYDNMTLPEHIEIAEYVEGKTLWNLYGEILSAGGEGIVITRKDCTYQCGKRTAWKTLKLKKELQDTIDAFLDGGYKEATKTYNGKEIESWKYWQNVKTNEKICGLEYFNYSNGAPIEPISKAYYYGWASAVSFSVMKDGKPYRIAWISGITDELKKEIVEKPEKWKNKVAELNAMEIEKINNICSLRHGKIETWRDDKIYTDCSYEQLEKEKDR